MVSSKTKWVYGLHPKEAHGAASSVSKYATPLVGLNINDMMARRAPPYDETTLVTIDNLAVAVIACPVCPINTTSRC